MAGSLTGLGSLAGATSLDCPERLEGARATAGMVAAPACPQARHTVSGRGLVVDSAVVVEAPTGERPARGHGKVAHWW